MEKNQINIIQMTAVLVNIWCAAFVIAGNIITRFIILGIIMAYLVMFLFFVRQRW